MSNAQELIEQLLKERAEQTKRSDKFRQANARLELARLNQTVSNFKKGNFDFLDKNTFTNEEWKKINIELWDKESVRFIENNGKMRLTRTSSPEILRHIEEKYGAPSAEEMHSMIQKDNYYHEQEMALLKKAFENQNGY